LKQILIILPLLLDYSSALPPLTKTEQAKQEMIKSLNLDINGTSKDTITNIITSSFNLKSYKENYLLPFSYRYDSPHIDNGIHESKDIETEFQVSIRYDIGSDLLGWGEIYSFGYTQRSWWQVYADSAFFRESNYQPELFVKIPTYNTLLKKSPIKGFKVAAIHQSNGRGGEYERSWNRLSLSTFIQHKNIIGELEMWYRLPDNIDYNPQLLDYLSYGKLKLMMPYHQHLFKLNLSANPSTHKSSAEFTYSYPLPVREEHDLFLFFKTFNGYGESLIDYNQNVNKVSIGVSISR
jgi:phospholipase A1